MKGAMELKLGPAMGWSYWTLTHTIYNWNINKIWHWHTPHNNKQFIQQNMSPNFSNMFFFYYSFDNFKSKEGTNNHWAHHFKAHLHFSSSSSRQGPDDGDGAVWCGSFAYDSFKNEWLSSKRLCCCDDTFLISEKSIKNSIITRLVKKLDMLLIN